METDKPLKDMTKKYLKDSIKEFIEGRGGILWILNVIEKSGALEYEGMLKETFNELEEFKENSRYHQVVEGCKEKGWI